MDGLHNVGWIHSILFGMSQDFCLLDVKFQKSSCVILAVSCSSAHPASLADVQKKSSELAAGHAWDIWRKPWKTSRESDSEEEEAQVIHSSILVWIWHSKAI